MITEPARLMLARRIGEEVSLRHVTVILGERGLSQKATTDAALAAFTGWRQLAVNGDWRAGGYLAGFQELLDEALRWCDANRPEIISQYEQSIKRMFPLYASPHFQVPKDLTNTSDKDERTRFYHHDYQNKLLVGLAEFLLDYLGAANTPTLLKIDGASSMSPTANNLLHIFLRNPSSAWMIKFVLFDYDRQVFIPQAGSVEFPRYDYREMNELLGLERDYAAEKAHRIYVSSRGNVMVARAILECDRFGIPVVGYLDSKTMVDLYLAAVGDVRRRELLLKYIAQNCESEDYIEIRNYETFDPELVDAEHQKRHGRYMAEYEAGVSPLVTRHAMAIRDKYKRLEALVEPSEILKSIGLYDTWFSYFGEMFSDPELRCYGSGDGPSNAVFINAAFVLYSLGCGKVSVPYLDAFYELFPESKFTPTVLYAQSMTYGRYQQPVNLPLAEQYALSNIKTIDEKFKGHEKYHYIKVFAENAYAYIKARQGKYDEARKLCTEGNRKMLEIYGDSKFKLHQSILIYNTSQVYEIVRDFDRAEAQLRLAISYDPYYGEYFNDLGNLLSKLPGRANEALAAYDTAIALCPPYYEAHVNRGLLHVSSGDHAAAMKDFERVLAIKPAEWRALLEIGNILFSQGEYKEARQMYRKAIAIEPLNADLQCNMGLACSECGEMEMSVAHYRTAIATDPGHAASHNNLAIELFNRGDCEEALRHSTLAAEIGRDPDYERNRVFLMRNVEMNSAPEKVTTK